MHIVSQRPATDTRPYAVTASPGDLQSSEVVTADGLPVSEPLHVVAASYARQADELARLTEDAAGCLRVPAFVLGAVQRLRVVADGLGELSVSLEELAHQAAEVAS